MIDSFDEKIVAVVVNSVDYKEFDKLYTLFTREHGKIQAYGFGVKKINSRKKGILQLFSFCNVYLKRNQDMYTVIDATIIQSFEELSSDYDTMRYASYFMEVVDYVGYENIDSRDIFELLYFTLIALRNGIIEKRLIKVIFDLKILKYQGEYLEAEMLQNSSETLKYTWNYVLSQKPNKLYTFSLKDEVFRQFEKNVNYEFKQKINKKFRSLDGIS